MNTAMTRRPASQSLSLLDFLFDPSFPGVGRPATLGIDVKRSDTGIEIHADAPGVTPDQVKMMADGNQLSISIERKEEARDRENGWARVERSHQSVSRTLMLPDDARVDEIQATLKNGVLTVSIPLEKPQVRTIPVQSE